MIYYTIVEKFDSQSGALWEKYRNDNGLNHLKELISLDSLLCPPVEFKESHRESLNDFSFSDSELYIDLKKSSEDILNNFDPATSNLLAIEWDPEQERSTVLLGFEFKGFDLVDMSVRVSVLVNCGRLEKAFKCTDLNQYGLVNNYLDAKKIQSKIKEQYPNLSHKFTTLIAIWVFAP